jgi:hypothetical protein
VVGFNTAFLAPLVDFIYTLGCILSTISPIFSLLHPQLHMQAAMRLIANLPQKRPTAEKKDETACKASQERC